MSVIFSGIYMTTSHFFPYKAEGRSPSIVHWNVAAAQGNPHSSKSETLEKTVYSEDAVFGTCNSSSFGGVKVGAKPH